MVVGQAHRIAKNAIRGIIRAIAFPFGGNSATEPRGGTLTEANGHSGAATVEEPGSRNVDSGLKAQPRSA